MRYLRVNRKLLGWLQTTPVERKGSHKAEGEVREGRLPSCEYILNFSM